MKSFMTGIAMILILMIFPVQQQLDTINAYRINSFNEIVYSSAEQARFDGYFTEENITETKNKIANVFKIDLSEIQFNATTSIKYRTNEYDEREKIEYEIIVPYKNIFASANFLKISDEDNNKTIPKRGYVFSEVLAP